MFENLDITTAKKFRKAIFAELSDYLKLVKSKDEGIADTSIWNELQDIKGQLYNYEISLDILIQRMQGLDIQNLSPSHTALQQVQRDFVDIRRNPRYINMFPQATERREHQDTQRKSPTPTPSAATAATSIFQPKQDRDPASLPVKERLLLQITSISIKTIDKSEAVRVIMAVAAPAGYNGYFLDVDKDAAPKVSEEGLHAIKELQDKLGERQKRLQKALAAEIDTLIQKSLFDGKNRLQIILKTGGHYTAVDVDLNKLIFFIIDAAQDFRRANLHTMSQYSRFIKPGNVIDVMSNGFEFDSRVINNGALQKSEHGCWIFALYHSFTLATLDIHSVMHERSKATTAVGGAQINCVEWIDLPPALICIGQSTTFISYYKSKHPEHSDEIDVLTNQNTLSFGYNMAVEKFVSLLKLVCQEKSNLELEELISKLSLHQAGAAHRKFL